MRMNPAGLALAMLAGLAAGALAQDSAAPWLAAQSDAQALLAFDALALAGRSDAPDADRTLAPADPLGNFHEVEPGFYRSAQPAREGYARLKSLGVRTILTFKDDDADERRAAGALGIKVSQVAMSGFRTPTFNQIDRALGLIATAQRPLLVHCERGRDRTGFVVAAYRVTVERASIEQAVAEAKSYGCCFALYEDLGQFLRRYRLHRRSPGR